MEYRDVAINLSANLDCAECAKCFPQIKAYCDNNLSLFFNDSNDYDTCGNIIYKYLKEKIEND